MPQFDTGLPADSLEFCPTPGFQDIFVCGTYKLLDEQESNFVPSPQSRRGKCLVFVLSADGSSFQQIQFFDLPAVLDMKWCHRDNSVPLLGVADSEGSISLHEWDERSLKNIDTIRCAPTNSLCLSLDWSNRLTKGNTLGSLVVSLSDGSLCLLSSREGSKFIVRDKWHAHDYEPWIAAWNYWDTNIIYSGGDDLCLKSWDIRRAFNQPASNNKRFEAGITSIQNNPHIEHLLAVGSYNNTVQLFDTRKLTSPVVQVDVGGGAWRVKWHPSEIRKQDLLVACMHDGFKVVRFIDGKSDGTSFSAEPQIIKRYDEHQSLAYGADWSYAPIPSSFESLVGCCSFYDHKMSMWEA